MDKRYLLQGMEKIMPLPDVMQIRNAENNTEKIFQTLQSLGIIPDASYQQNNFR